MDDIMVSGEEKPVPPPPKGKVNQISATATTLTLGWNVFGGGNYTVQYCDDLTVGNWQPVGGMSWPTCAVLPRSG